MTYTYHCESCGINFTFSEDSEQSVEGEWGMKNSCCHNCSNPECPDYGECNCFDEWLEKQREIMDKMIADGTFPHLPEDDE